MDYSEQSLYHLYFTISDYASATFQSDTCIVILGAKVVCILMEENEIITKYS